MCITNTAHVHAQQFQLGAHVCASEGVIITEDVVSGDLRHFVARGNQTVDVIIPAGALTDGIDIRI